MVWLFSVHTETFVHYVRKTPPTALRMREAGKTPLQQQGSWSAGT